MQPMSAPDIVDADHDALTQAAGLDYGPAFRAISGIWREGQSVCARFLTPESISEDLPRTHLHPALLDCAFQLIIELLQDDSAASRGTVFVPVRIEELTWLAGAGQPALARATLLRRNPNSLSAQFTLFDRTGKPVAAIKTARFQKITVGRNQPDRLRRLEYRRIASPHPLASSRAPQHLYDNLFRQLGRNRPGGPASRYATELEPLLDVLCSRYALQALRSLSAENGTLSRNRIDEHKQAGPTTAPLLDFLIETLCEDGLLRSEGTDWRFTDGINAPEPADIWNSLLRDYPDYLPAIHAVGQVGMHLADLLQGLRTADQVMPRDCSLGALSHRLLLDSGLGSVSDAAIDAITETLQQLSSGGRLNAIEFCAGQPLFAQAIIAAIDNDRCRYAIGSVTPGFSETCLHLKEKNPGIELRQIDPKKPVDAKPVPANQQFQLIIINPDFPTEADALLALSQARHWLAPQGVVLLLEQQRTRWLDFVCGIRQEWWSGAAETGWTSRHKGPGFWRKHMQRIGLHAIKAMELSIEHGVGPFVVCAQAKDGDIRLPTETKSHNWILFADKDEDEHSARLALQLQNTLQGRGDRVFIATPASHFGLISGHRYQLDTANPAQVEALFADTVMRFGKIDGVLHLQGMASGNSSSAPLLQMERQLDRCAVAAAILKARSSMELDARCWLLTAGVSQCSKTVATAATSAPTMDAALWGFGRTAMNEVPGTALRLIDIDPATPVDAVAFLVGREITQPDAEQEVAFTLSGDRQAYRLRAHREQPSTARTDSADTAVRLAISTPGQLRNLHWQTIKAALPQENEVEIDVCAAGLNFRDVMYSLGALTDDAVEGGFAGPGLGLEFSGTVSRTGPGVTGFKTGDRVLGFGAHSFSNRLIASVTSIAAIPGAMSLSAAATIPSAFLTVHYALNRLARIEQGERILIHGAAGGVGLAAIQFAKRCGAEIFATAGSREKRDFLRLLGVDHVFDSRSLAFADEILAITAGQGVDVILNSLAGEAINRNLKALRPFGRFLELGKRDFQENTRIGLRPFRNNISYFAVDADQLMKERPELTAHLFQELMQMFADGTLQPLPFLEFAATDAVNAFRHMQQSRHIGKIVITQQSPI